MDDWLREGLNDIASEAPGGLEVPTTLKPRARRRMTLTVLISFVLVSSLTVAAFAGVGAIRNAPVPGDSPSPSVEPPEQDANHVTVTLTESGCALESSGGVADRALLRVRIVNETDERAVFDIGRLIGDHTVAELAEYVGANDSRPVREVSDATPTFFRRHVHGLAVVRGPDGYGANPIPRVGDTPAVWQPSRWAHGGTYAMVCFREPLPGGALLPVGVAGPIELAQQREDTAPDPNHVTLTLTESGCTLESSGRVADPAQLRVLVVNETDDRAFVDIGRLDDGHTVAELAEHVRERRPPSATPTFFRRHVYGHSVSTGGSSITTLPEVGITPAVWQPAPRARGGSYVMVCYRDPASGDPFVPVGVVGPIEFAQREETEPDPNRVIVRLTESGCILESSGQAVDPDELRILGVNKTDERAVFDVGRITGSHTVADLADHIGGFALRPIPSLDAITPPFFRRYVAGSVKESPFSVSSLFRVGSRPLVWTSHRTMSAGTYAIICHRESLQDGVRIPVGVVGPIEVGPAA